MNFNNILVGITLLISLITLYTIYNVNNNMDKLLLDIKNLKFINGRQEEQSRVQFGILAGIAKGLSGV
jgi:hypothetical protein